jgi:transcription antitermination factor NusG
MSSSQSWEFAVTNPDMGAEIASWYAVQTRARHEKAVERRLREQGVEVFLPLVTEVRRWSDRRKRLDLPLFGCYVFVRLALTDEQRFRVCNVDGVFNFVGVRKAGTPIPDEQIDAIRTLVGQQLPWSTHPFLKVGQRVRIRSGALDGLEGILVSRNGDRKLVVSVDAIQRSLAVRIDGYDLEPA